MLAAAKCRIVVGECGRPQHAPPDPPSLTDIARIFQNQSRRPAPPSIKTRYDSFSFAKLCGATATSADAMHAHSGAE
jgi:hypothetical protein